MRLSLRPYIQEDDRRWDEFCERADQSTFLHTRRFLGYHGSRFIDRSLVFEEDGKWVGLLPAAQDRTESNRVVSHPGISYGGVVHCGRLRGEKMVMGLTRAKEYYRAMGYETFVYKAVPTFYHRKPAQDDLYALFRLGAKRVRCDLSAVIDLACRGQLSERRRRCQKRALKSGVVVQTGIQYLHALWDVVVENLASKHRVAPVHTVTEMELLMGCFPNDIMCVCAVKNQQVLAGVILFATPTANHAQYIASSRAGYEVSALEPVIERCIADTSAAGKRWFDFGISTESSGSYLNEGLYDFKTEFGGGGFVHDFFELPLRGA